MKSALTNPELYQLSRPVPARFVKAAPAGKHGTYVPHYVISQRLLAILGPYSFDHVETIRGYVPPLPKSGRDEGMHPAIQDAVTGVIMQLTVEIDGRVVSVSEAGSADAAGYEWNDGERLKKAMSDAFKRCAMRLGVGIHLWCKNELEFFLPQALRLNEQEEHPDDESPVIAGEEIGVDA